MPQTKSEPDQTDQPINRRLIVFIPIAVVSLYCVGLIATQTAKSKQPVDNAQSARQNQQATSLGQVVQPVRPTLNSDIQFSAGPANAAISPESVNSASPSAALQNSPSSPPALLNQTLQAPTNTSNIDILAL